MIGALKTYCRNHKPFLIYGFVAVFVTVIDVAISFGLEHVVDKMYANAAGVITGFIIQYFMSSKQVFNVRNLRAFIVYLLTFGLGLLLAELIILFSRDVLFGGVYSLIAFGASKGLSIVIPFFITYFIRKKLLTPGKVESNEKDSGIPASL